MRRHQKHRLCVIHLSIFQILDLIVRYLKLEVKEIACLHNKEPSSEVSKDFALLVSKIMLGIKEQRQKIQIDSK